MRKNITVTIRLAEAYPKSRISEDRSSEGLQKWCMAHKVEKKTLRANNDSRRISNTDGSGSRYNSQDKQSNDSLKHTNCVCRVLLGSIPLKIPSQIEEPQQNVPFVASGKEI